MKYYWIHILNIMILHTFSFRLWYLTNLATLCLSPHPTLSGYHEVAENGRNHKQLLQSKLFDKKQRKWPLQCVITKQPNYQLDNDRHNAFFYRQACVLCACVVDSFCFVEVCFLSCNLWLSANHFTTGNTLWSGWRIEPHKHIALCI